MQTDGRADGEHLVGLSTGTRQQDTLSNGMTADRNSISDESGTPDIHTPRSHCVDKHYVYYSIHHAKFADIRQTVRTNTPPLEISPLRPGHYPLVR